MTGQDHGEPARPYEDPPTTPRRKRVVLADSRAPVTVLRTVVELQKQTSYGEELVSQLVRRQLRFALGVWAPVVGLLGGPPVLFHLLPELADTIVGGLPVSWWTLAVGSFALLFGVGCWYNRGAEQRERQFVAQVGK